MAESELLVIALVMVVAAAIVHVSPGAAESILWWRKILFGIAGLLVALLLIATGVPLLMFVGAIGLGLAFLWVFLEQPHEDFVPK